MRNSPGHENPRYIELDEFIYTAV